jgi:hypothetical protein
MHPHKTVLLHISLLKENALLSLVVIREQVRKWDKRGDKRVNRNVHKWVIGVREESFLNLFLLFFYYCLFEHIKIDCLATSIRHECTGFS